MISDLTQAFEGPFDGFLSALRKRLSQLGVRMVNDRVVPVAEADAHATEVIELMRGTVLPRLAERPGDALRVLDALRGTGFAHLEHERARCERERDLRYPPPPAATRRASRHRAASCRASCSRCTRRPATSRSIACTSPRRRAASAPATRCAPATGGSSCSTA